MGDWKDLFEIVKSVTTSIGIIVAGIWTYMLFIRQRLSFPRVNIDLIIDDVVLREDRRLVHAEVKISNTGNVLLHSHRAELRLRQVVPIPEDLRSVIADGYDPVKNAKTEIAWPMVAGRNWEWNRGSFEIEPGESDSLHADFVIPTDLQVSEFYCFVANAKKKAQGIGWTLTKLHRFPHKQEDKTMANRSGKKKETTQDKSDVKKQQRQQEAQRPQQQQQPTQPKKEK